MYWCNCIEASRAAGRHLGRTTMHNGISIFLQVPTTQDHLCVHCGHTAFFSKTDPNHQDVYDTPQEKRAL